MGYIVAGVMAAILVAALIIGIVKGFIKTKTWASEYLFALVFSVLIFTLADLSEINAWIAAALKIGVAVVFLLLFTFLSTRCKAFLKKCIENSRQRSYYEQHGEREEHTSKVLDSIELRNDKEYRKLVKQKFKEKRGPAGVVDRICGGFSLLVKAVVIIGVIAAAILVTLDFTQMTSVLESLSSIYSSNAWEFFSKIVMDVFVIGIIHLAIRCGYRSGIISTLWSIMALVLIVGAAYLSYWMCFNVDNFIKTAEGMSGNIESFAQTLIDLAAFAGIEMTVVNVAQGILTAIVFVIFFIAIIILKNIVSGIIYRAREGKAVKTVDGVFGAILYFVIVVAVMLIVGAVLYTIEDLPAMEVFNSYFSFTDDGETKYAAIASVFYGQNPLSELEFITSLPIHDWFVSSSS